MIACFFPRGSNWDQWMERWQSRGGNEEIPKWILTKGIMSSRGKKSRKRIWGGRLWREEEIERNRDVEIGDIHAVQEEKSAACWWGYKRTSESPKEKFSLLWGQRLYFISSPFPLTETRTSYTSDSRFSGHRPQRAGWGWRRAFHPQPRLQGKP